MVPWWVTHSISSMGKSTLPVLHFTDWWPTLGTWPSTQRVLCSLLPRGRMLFKRLKHVQSFSWNFFSKRQCLICGLTNFFAHWSFMGWWIALRTRILQVFRDLRLHAFGVGSSRAPNLFCQPIPGTVCDILRCPRRSSCIRCVMGHCRVDNRLHAVAFKLQISW